MDNGELKLANLGLLAIALVFAANAVNAKVRLPVVQWSTVSEALSCPYMQPPECITPLPGL